VGSSRNISAGLLTIAVAMFVRLRSPPDTPFCWLSMIGVDVVLEVV
jgi:hypothetical protein